MCSFESGAIQGEGKFTNMNAVLVYKVLVFQQLFSGMK